MKRGDTGAKVKELQQSLVALGYHLPHWGVDGDLGTETLDALALFLRDHGVEVEDDTNVVTAEQLALLTKVRLAHKNVPVGPSLAAGKFHDLRGSSSQIRVYGRRAWGAITGITLHQTACVLGERPQRWETVGAHAGVTRGGQVIWMHDFNQLVIHGNGFNAKTVGIEMDGEYAGVEGELRTFWRPKDEPDRKPQTPTPQLISAAKATVRWICEAVARHGGAVKVLVAHRQASEQRQSDPGSALWKAVAMPLHEELGLDDGGPGFKIGSGYAIPEKWDPSRTGVKY